MNILDVLLPRKVVRKIDGKVLTCIQPNPELGYYRTMVTLMQEGYDIKNLISVETVELNPSRFEEVGGNNE